jgi:hypothetical protein
MLGIGILAISVVPAMADDPTVVFEVGDGDTAPVGSGTPNCDWNTLNSGKTANSTTPSASCPNGGPDAYSFLVGGSSEKAFTTGGSKDSNLISSWKWSNTSTPDKDTLTHGYGASFTDGSGHNILAFGGERFDVNGDANIGVWFFQQTVAPVGSGTSGSFSGAHVDGDIFAVSAFTTGGSHPELDIYKWDSTCSASHYPTPTLPLPSGGACASTNLKWIFAGLGNSICGGSDACSSVNNTPITPSWTYVGKGGGTVPVAGFYEGGLDLTNLLPSSSGTCFTSFLLETRSSQSVSAVLKDFVSGSFPQCHVTVSKACACTTLHTDGTGYDYAAGGTVTNDGTGPLLNVKVTDDQIANVIWNCGSMAKGDVKSWGNMSPTGLTGACTASGGTAAGQGGAFTSTSTSVSNTAHVVADTTSGPNPTQITNDSQVTCAYPGTNNVCQSNATLTVTNSCVTALEVKNGTVVVRVDYTGTVKNSGNVNVTGVAVTGTNTGSPASPTFTIGTLTPGQEVCYTNGAASPTPGCPSIALSDFGPGPASTPTGAASYYPNSLTAATTATGVSPGRARFTGRVQASGTNAATSASISSDPSDAFCLVCDNGFCPDSPKP